MKIFRNLIRLFFFLIFIWPFTLAAVICALMELISDKPMWAFYREYWTFPDTMKFWSLK